MTSVMHDIFLLYTLFVHPLYFMKLTKISKCVNILFPLLGIPKKLFFLLIKYSLCPHHEHVHWRQHRVQGHIKPQKREQSCPWCYFWVNLIGAIPLSNSIKAAKRFWTLAAHVNHLGSSLRDSSLFVLRGAHIQQCSLGSPSAQESSQSWVPYCGWMLCWWRRVQNTCISGILSNFCGL